MNEKFATTNYCEFIYGKLKNSLVENKISIILCCYYSPKKKKKKKLHINLYLKLEFKCIRMQSKKKSAM
jgi:hypothetical protein